LAVSIAIAKPMPCAYTPGSLAGDHLWLIFLIILLFAAYPAAFAALSLAFLRTFHLVLAGMGRQGRRLTLR
jgi:cytochrome bd-type quinol oxidase subunit 2